ncbi:thioester domain-containing protein [Phytomonospora sp. NPDC050363]|uniref:thioester domain-containing protein n=1 Tax=Phytomonospora sp. NPDC050363 TaxID=3155642 RepID=UPI0033C13F71
MKIRRSFVNLLVVAAATAAAVLALAPAAVAEPDPDLVVGGPAHPFTELEVTGLIDGMAVSAFDGPASLDPLAGYPATPPAGSTPHEISYAGTIQATDNITGTTALTYCIDLATETGVGVHYKLGEWSEANVPHLGYVGYILHNYFPTTGAPAGGTVDERAARVQLAIWFFTDRVVLDPVSPHYAAVSAIVADALANGPSVEPDPPTLTVTPSTMRAPSNGELVGPFHVESDGPSTIRSLGIEVFSDPEGDNRLDDGDTVDSGADLWVRTISDDDPQGFVLDRTVSLLESTVYLYDGTNPGRDTAQKLILAQQTTLAKRAGALITPYAAGNLAITKSITGSGAGLQGEVVIDVVCTTTGDVVTEYRLKLDAKTAAGDHPLEVTGIEAGSTCVITESSDGDNGLVNATVTIEPAEVTIVENGTAEATVTDDYTRGVGAVAVTKTIAGRAAGDQGEIRMRLECTDPHGGEPVTREFTIDAGASPGTYVQPVVEDLPAGMTCRLTEPADGGNEDVELAGGVVIKPGSVTVADGETAAIAVTDTFEFRKTLPVTGPGPVGALALAGAVVFVTGAALLVVATVRRRRRT